MGRTLDRLAAVGVREDFLIVVRDEDALQDIFIYLFIKNDCRLAAEVYKCSNEKLLTNSKKFFLHRTHSN